MFYLDTSFIVSALSANEVDSEQSRDWLAANIESSMVVSDWVDTEVSSALSLKVRTGEMTLEQRADVLTEWNRFRDSSLSVIAVAREDFQKAAAFAQRHSLGLRAGDALHLALVQSIGGVLVTLDKKMALVAPEFGIVVAAE
jgi:uncharacterized protein